MGRWRYTSDLHFNHPFIAGLRGFSPYEGQNGRVRGNVEEHDAAIIEYFNAGIRSDDITVIAGDVAMNWKGAAAKVAQLQGIKILVWGNHDVMFGGERDAWKHQQEWLGEGKFHAIMAFMRRRSAGREFLVSHFPYEGDHTEHDRHTQYRLPDEGLWLLHGHTHSKEKQAPLEPQRCFFCGGDADTCGDHTPRVNRQLHIGVDAWGLRPVYEEQVIDLMNSQEKLHLDTGFAEQV